MHTEAKQTFGNPTTHKLSLGIAMFALIGIFGGDLINKAMGTTNFGAIGLIVPLIVYGVSYIVITKIRWR